MRFKKDNLPL